MPPELVTSATGTSLEPVQVWSVPATMLAEAGRLVPSLSVAEQARAARLRSAEARASFVVTRVALRDILADSLDCRPGELVFAATTDGKPILANDRAWQFSVSHAPDRALIALHPTRSVGIDVEASTRTVDETMFTRVCTAAEAAGLADSPSHTRARRFLRLWVRKEAVAKADGRGLALMLDGLDVRRTGPLAVEGSNSEHVWLQDLDVGPTHFAALATVGGPVPLQSYRWPDDSDSDRQPPPADHTISRHRELVR